MIRLCVTGGSGFIGTSVVDWAISAGLLVINFDIKPPKIASQNKYWKYVDIRNYSELENAFSDFMPTHILHLAATTGMDVEDIEYFNANTYGVKNLIDASKVCQSLKRILFTSSLLVCRNGYIPKFETDYCPPNIYGKSKMIGEQFVRESNMIVSWSIVRPTSVWGPWFEHSYLKFFQIISRNLYFHIRGVSIVKPQTFVKNTAYMMQKILFSNSDAVHKETFYLADYPEITTNEWADLIAKNLSKRKKIRSMPYSLIKLFALCGDLLKLIGITDPPLTSFRLKNMMTGAAYPISNTREIVGPLPFSTFEGVSETINWMSKSKLI